MWFLPRIRATFSFARARPSSWILGRTLLDGLVSRFVERLAIVCGCVLLRCRMILATGGVATMDLVAHSIWPTCVQPRHSSTIPLLVRKRARSISPAQHSLVSAIARLCLQMTWRFSLSKPSPSVPVRMTQVPSPPAIHW